MSPITIYTDGSALGNPGRAATAQLLLSGHHRKELSRVPPHDQQPHGAVAVCVALETLKFEGSDVVIYSDSKYVVDAVSKGWVFGWVRKGFAGKKNPDLWMRFLRVYNRHNVRFVWVKGQRRNSREQPLRLIWAVAAANDKAHWLEDTGYDPAERKTEGRRTVFRHKVHHNPSNYRTFFAFRVIIPIFTPLIA